QEDLEYLGPPPTRPQSSQRQRPAAARRPRAAQEAPYHYEDHPEIPRIRRASLHQSPAPKHPTAHPGSKKTRYPEPDTEMTNVPNTPKRSATGTTRRPYQYDEDERTTTSLHHKHVTVGAPPRVHRPQHPHAKRTLQGRLQHLSHNQGFLVIASLT